MVKFNTWSRTETAFQSCFLIWFIKEEVFFLSISKKSFHVCSTQMRIQFIYLICFVIVRSEYFIFSSSSKFVVYQVFTFNFFSNFFLLLQMLTTDLVLGKMFWRSLRDCCCIIVVTVRFELAIFMHKARSRWSPQPPLPAKNVNIWIIWSKKRHQFDFLSSPTMS